MYLHIGKNCVIKNNNVIGIFNTNTIENTDEYKELLKNIDIKDFSNNQKKTFILTEENSIIRGYISNIGVKTIEKRKIQKANR